MVSRCPGGGQMIYANARRSHKFIVACRLNLLDEADDDAIIWLESTATAALAK